MPNQSWCKSGVLAYFGPQISHSGHIFWDMNFKFVLPIISIYIKRQTKLEVNWTQIDHFSLQKNHKIGHISVSHFAQVSILHFSMNLSETFRIDVNMDFANTNDGGFLIYASKKIVSPK